MRDHIQFCHQNNLPEDPLTLAESLLISRMQWDGADKERTQLRAEVEQLRQLHQRTDESRVFHFEKAEEARKERDTLRQRCEALEAALNGSYSFVKGFHWLTPHDEPTYTQRKDTLKAIEELLKPDAAISAQAHGNGGEAMPKPRWKADGATVFEHGRIAFTCHTPKGARRIVALLNDAESAKAVLAVYKALFTQGELDQRVKDFNDFEPAKIDAEKVRMDGLF